MRLRTAAVVLTVAAGVVFLIFAFLWLGPQPQVRAAYTEEAQDYLSRAEQGIYTEPFSLHTATAEQLQQIPGVGPVLSERIVSFLRQHGPIERVEELDAVEGVGPALVETIRQYTTLS